jgi:thiol-disulfide isomerase/thioredoxin
MHRLLLLLIIVSASLVAACNVGSTAVEAPRTAPPSERRPSAEISPSSVISAPSMLRLHTPSDLEVTKPSPPSQARTSPQKVHGKTALEPRSSREVPAFQLTDVAGKELNSEELIGHQAFVVVFFATWCELCSRKMPMVRRALEKVHGVRVLLVAVDSTDTWNHVPGFLREQRLSEEQVINGLEFPAFTRGYNPVSSIPLVAIVSQSGELVDYQIGLLDGDGPRLEAALRSAVSSP